MEIKPRTGAVNANSVAALLSDLILDAQVMQIEFQSETTVLGGIWIRGDQLIAAKIGDIRGQEAIEALLTEPNLRGYTAYRLNPKDTLGIEPLASLSDLLEALTEPEHIARKANKNIVSSEPETVSNEVQAEVVSSEPETETISSEIETISSEPETISNEVQAEVVSSEPEAEVVSSEVQAEVVSNEVQAEVVSSELETETISSETEITPDEVQSEIVSNEVQAEVISSEPEIVSSEPETEVAPSEVEAEIVSSQPEPVVSSQPEIPVAKAKPVAPKQPKASAKKEPQVLAIVSAKGGVGKTTLSLNMAVMFAHQGLSVILIDTDPQGGITNSLIPAAVAPQGIYDVLMSRVTFKEVLKNTRFANLRLLPAGQLLPDEIINKSGQLAKPELWRRILTSVARVADIVIVDTPAGVQGVTTAILAAATHTVLISQPEPLSLRALPQVRNTLQALAKTGSAAQLVGVIVNMASAQRVMPLELLQATSKNVINAQSLLQPMLVRHDAFVKSSASASPLALSDNAQHQEIVAQLGELSEALLERLGHSVIPLSEPEGLLV